MGGTQLKHATIYKKVTMIKVSLCLIFYYNNLSSNKNVAIKPIKKPIYLIPAR